MELTYTDEGFNELGLIRSFAMDMAFGVDENDFEITVPIDLDIPIGGFVYADLTEYGGVIRKREVSTYDDIPKRIYSGATWHGILNERIMCPSGDYITKTGRATTIIKSVLSDMGMDMFAVEASTLDSSASFQFDRFCTVYEGFRKLCAKRGLKLKIKMDSKPTIYVEKALEPSDDGSSYGIRYRIAKNVPTNHLVCLGKDELSERVVVHLYADADGNVSTNQTMSGIDEVAEVYDSNNSDKADLTEKGTEQLESLQDIYSAELELEEGCSWDVGDTVGIYDDATGMSVSSTVSKVIVKVDEIGNVTISNELSDIAIGA